MIKIDLARTIAERMDTTLKQADEFLTIWTDLVGECLSTGEPVQLANFGQFSVRFVPEHTGRNPKTGEVLQVPANYYPMFRAGKGLREKVALINNPAADKAKTTKKSLSKLPRSKKQPTTELS